MSSVERALSTVCIYLPRIKNYNNAFKQSYTFVSPMSNKLVLIKYIILNEKNNPCDGAKKF